MSEDAQKPSAAEPAGKKPILEFVGVSKSFKQPRNGDSIQVLKEVNFSIEDEESGEFIALLGPSGAGKSTILNLISGMLMPDTGEIHLMGRKVFEPHKNTVTVPQAYTCYPWRTVHANVEFGLELKGIPAKVRRDTASEYLEKVGLKDRMEAFPKELSGGMQQRVAIARALAMKPPMVLMDEPFGALDAQTRAEMQQMLLQLWGAEKNLIFFITHDIAEALLLANRVLVLGNRPSQVVLDMHVPFERPRGTELTTNPQFASKVQEIMAVLRHEAQVHASG